MSAAQLDALAINTIRTLSIDAIEKAASGHPGLPLGAAPMAYVLWQRHLKHNPGDPGWPDRDRFVLSGGHGSMLLYALLHLTGYDLSLDDLKRFRQWESKTPGHPEAHVTPGVEATTGPLGQGSANAVGMAIAERAAASLYNRDGHPLVDHFTYALVTDGDLMEGVNAEAASLAGHLHLGKLIYLYDANGVSLDGPTDLSYSEDVGKRYEAYGWHVQTVDNGDTDLGAIDAALHAAKAAFDKPSLIIVRTTIGYGSPNRQGTSSAHGAPLGEAEAALTKTALGWQAPEPFHVPAAVTDHMTASAQRRGQDLQQSWQNAFDAYAQAFPREAGMWRDAQAGRLPEDWLDALPSWNAGEHIATRSASGKILDAIAAKVPWLLGGDADLSCSTKTALRGATSFDGTTGAGRHIRFGVREHAMGAIANGIAYHGGFHPFAATFFVFSDYMRPAVRLAALNSLPVTYIWTHDSIGVGEDGPTHQPVEHLMALRAMPNLTVLRPADANETRYAWQIAMTRRDGPVALVLSRQNLPVFDRARCGGAAGTLKGGYVLAEANGTAQAIIIATGSEVAIALQAQAQLAQDGIPVRVVSLPAWDLFEKQSAAYRESVLPRDIPFRVAVEAGVGLGWHRYVGAAGEVVGIETFGASAPGEVLMHAYGITAEAVAAKVHALLRGTRPTPG